jgi:hypothetical protein
VACKICRAQTFNNFPYSFFAALSQQPNKQSKRANLNLSFYDPNYSKSKNKQNLVLLFVWMLRKWKGNREKIKQLNLSAAFPMQQLPAFEKKKTSVGNKISRTQTFYCFCFLAALIFSATKHGSKKK